MAKRTAKRRMGENAQNVAKKLQISNNTAPKKPTNSREQPR